MIGRTPPAGIGSDSAQGATWRAEVAGVAAAIWCLTANVTGHADVLPHSDLRSFGSSLRPSRSYAFNVLPFTQVQLTMNTSFQCASRQMGLSIVLTCLLTTGCGGGGPGDALVLPLSTAQAASIAAPLPAALSASSNATSLENLASDPGRTLTLGAAQASVDAVAGLRVDATLTPQVPAQPASTVVLLDASPPASSDTSNAVVSTSGVGLQQRLAVGCSPRLNDDFIDSGSWDNRRLMPRDCLRVLANPPVFAWRQPSDRDPSAPWSFMLRSITPGGTTLALSVQTPRLALHQALQPGNYEWAVSYRTKAGAMTGSAARRFSVDAGAPAVLFPDGASLASRVVARAHPKVLPLGGSFAELRRLALAGDQARTYTDLIAVADTAMKAPLPASSDTAAFSYSAFTMASAVDMVALRSLCDTEKRYVEALGYAYRFTADKRYADAGIQRVINLSRWPADGATSEKNFDYGNRAVYQSLAMALDLFGDSLSAAQVKDIAAPLAARLAQAMARFAGLDINPFDSHVDIIVWSVLEALLYSAGTPGFEQGERWLAQTWDLLLTTANSWGADDGGFGNGVAYAWYRLDNMSQALAAIRTIANVNFAQHPSVARFGDYLVAFTAPRGKHMSAFGDDVERTTHYANYAANQFRLYASLTQSPLHAWYWQVGSIDTKTGQDRSPWHLMLLGTVPPVSGVPPTVNSWVFEDAGVTALHSATASADRSSVYFRSSEFGSWVHSFADQNSFTLVSKGKDLLISGGYYPYFFSPHHVAITRATRYKNALTFDGGIGQAEPEGTGTTAPGRPVESRDPRGRLLNHADNGSWAASTGDATLAYRSYNSVTRAWKPLLNEAVRTVAYNRKEKVLVVYDYATSATARRWELNFNALSAFDIQDNIARVSNAGASGCIQVYGPAGTLSSSSGFAVAPENGARDQYQSRFSVSTKSNELAAVTVVTEDCRAVPLRVTVAADGSASVSIDGGAPISFAGRTFTMR